MIQSGDVTITNRERAELKRTLRDGLRGGNSLETLHSRAVSVLDHPPLLVQVRLSGFSPKTDGVYPETTASFPQDDVKQSIEIEVSPG